MEGAVDGKIIRTSTIWQTKIIDTFPSGSRSEFRGAALIFPVGNGKHIYGTFRGIIDNTIMQPTTISSIIDNAARIRDMDEGRITSRYRTANQHRRYAIDLFQGDPIRICMEPKEKVTIYERCLLFVYTDDKVRPRRFKIIRAGVPYGISGTSFIINDVRISFKSAKHEIEFQPKGLPVNFSMKGKAIIGSFSDRLQMGAPKKLHTDDFWRP